MDYVQTNYGTVLPKQLQENEISLDAQWDPTTPIAEKGMSSWERAVVVMSPPLDNYEHAENCKEERAATLNESALAKKVSPTG